jgi:hypothetical protein
MNIRTILVISAAWAALAGAAAAQTSTPAQSQSAATAAEPDSARLALARRLFDLQGGEKQVAAQMKAQLDIISRSVQQNVPPEAARLVKPLYDDMTLEMVGLTPRIVDLSVKLYAETFTEKELGDWIAFQESPSGQAIIQKTPQVRAKLIEQVLPMAMQFMPEMMRKAGDRVCEEQHCTAEQRRAVAAAMAKALPAKAN